MDSDDDHSSKAGSVERNSSSNDGSTTGTHATGSGNSDDDIQNIKDALTKRETKAVFKLRVLVIMILVAAAISISCTVFYVTRNAEKEEFQIQYYAMAEKVLQSLQDVMVEISAVSGLAVAASADSAEQDAKWPFITMSNFQERAGNAKTLSGALYVSISPIVPADELPDWEKYVRGTSNKWIDEGLRFQEYQGINNFADPEQVEKSWITRGVVDPLHTFDDAGVAHLSAAQGPFLPVWQASPVLLSSMVNENLFENHQVAAQTRDCIESQAAVLGGFVTAPPGPTSHPDPLTSLFATLRSMSEEVQVEYLGDPMAEMTIPIFDALNSTNREVVAVLKSTIHWQSYLRNLLPSTVHGITVVVNNACDGYFTYEINGEEAHVIGFDDLHDSEFDEYLVEGRFLTEVIDDGTLYGLRLNQEGCPYTFHVYPTATYYEAFITNDPVIISLSVGAVILFTILMFLAYDRLVERRQRMVLAKATQSTAIVSSLFPKQVRERLLTAATEKRKGDAMLGPNHRLKSFLSGSPQANEQGQQSIADFFPHCTVLFADIEGFTAWSSSREPAQVFVLLQTVYQAFDLIAKRRKVFKVETIGDSYVAVTGLPEPQAKHAVIMAKFAWDCLIRINKITRELEVTLGPDTGDLSMRFGLHSGAVTAGVLKGDRARFQLFGDTVNTAARMESTGIKGRIQVSNATAHILKECGKGSWLTRREDGVMAKGKGVLDTYWLTAKTTVHAATSSRTSSEDAKERAQLLKENEGDPNFDRKEARLVNWMADLLMVHIKKVVAIHERVKKDTMNFEDMYYELSEGEICLDEVKDAINMPKFNADVMDATLDASLVEVPNDIVESFKEYVWLIAKSYRRNSFHNFEHACHVTMSVNKLLSRIVAPDLVATNYNKLKEGRDEVAAKMHDFTHGITSDPMAVFAITFSALIHDVDHQGVSNTQLIREEPEMGKMYHNKSVAEQNSLDIAWNLLMSTQFDNLRKYIFRTRAEMLRFRQLIVNVVLATDIFDKELGALRKSRWDRAFHGDGSLHKSVVDDLRATIVMEHIIQASDVSHTMQHWHVYTKWNRKLFGELYQAWKDDRMEADPSTFWYQGELSFFDNYIIPLAKKLKECNVFGVSSDEYLGYAERNRAEWEDRGEVIVAEMVEAFNTPELDMFPAGSSMFSTHSTHSTASIESNYSSRSPIQQGLA